MFFFCHLQCLQTDASTKHIHDTGSNTSEVADKLNLSIVTIHMSNKVGNDWGVEWVLANTLVSEEGEEGIVVAID